MLQMLAIDFDLATSADDVSITCTRLNDGDKKWELELVFADGQRLKRVIEPDDPSMEENNDDDYDVWCFCDFVDINFWREHDFNEKIQFFIYSVEVGECEDGGSTYTNTSVEPVCGIVEFKNEN